MVFLFDSLGLARMPVLLQGFREIATLQFFFQTILASFFQYEILHFYLHVRDRSFFGMRATGRIF